MVNPKAVRLHRYFVAQLSKAAPAPACSPIRPDDSQSDHVHMHHTNPMRIANLVYCILLLLLYRGELTQPQPLARRGSHLSPANRRSQGRRGG